jgi:hypothetical protein
MITRTLKRGESGPEIKAVQELLEPYNPGAADGIYGPVTAAALHRFRADHGLLDDPNKIGAIDAIVMAAMHDRLAAKWCEQYGVTSLRMRALVSMHSERNPRGDANWHAAEVARAFVTRGIAETSNNRGPWVDDIVRIGGGNPETRPHWCGYFAACCRRIAERWYGAELDYTTSGGAVRAWQRAGEHLRVDAPVVGAVYHRTRTSDPASRVAVARDGGQVPGHTGVVVELLPDGGGFVGVGGNSSGAGHSGAGRGGRVAYEVIRTGDKAHARLVGFTICTPKVSA